MLFSRRQVGLAAWPPANKPFSDCVSAGVPWLLAGTCGGRNQVWMLLAAWQWHCGALLRHQWCNQVTSVVCAEPPQCTPWLHCLAPAHAYMAGTVA